MTAANLTAVTKLLHGEFKNPRYELEFETPVQLLVATILAAQSTDEGVNRVTRKLFKSYPDARAFVDVDTATLEEAIKPCGLAKQKAKTIQGACRELLAEHGGGVPKSMDALVALPGIGRKTANVVLQTAYAQITGVIVDTHVARVCRRLGLTTLDKPEEIETELMAVLPKQEWLFFGPAMVLHGRRVCLAKRPACDRCSLATLCPRIGVEGTSP